LSLRFQERFERGKTVLVRTRDGLYARVGLAGVKAKALFKGGRVSRVRSGSGRVRQVKVKSLSGVGCVSRVRLAGLTLVSFINSNPFNLNSNLDLERLLFTK
jgi:hypothetical protein